LESPIVVTGSAIGSNYSRFYHLSFQDRTLLLACGAAAGISAAFSAPIAGVLFAIEVLLTEVTVAAFTPLLLAAATGALCNRILLQEGALFYFNVKEPFHYENVPFYIGLGIVCGLVSVYYSRMAWKVEALFDKYKRNVYGKAIVGGLLLGVMIFLFPPLFGEGYQSIKTLSTGDTSRLLAGSIFAEWRFNEWAVLIFIGVTGLMKVFAAMTTISSGGNGGNFAPSMFVGAYTGYFFAKLVNLLGLSELPEGNFTMVGMAGIVSGVIHAPLTGIFLIAEITGGYQLMIPLMIVAAVAYALVKYIEPFSLDTKHLAARGQLHRVDKDKAVLKNLRIINLIETDYQTINPETTLGELTHLIAARHQPVYPVLNEKAQLVGLVQLNDIREMLFKTELYDKVRASEIMVLPLAVVQKTEDMNSVMRKFDETNALLLPVSHQSKFIGFISKSGVFTRYRKLLIRYTQE
jgi:CIC family chloride channel protein